jgi:predicted N-acetyltransferase YhbS
MQQGIDASRDRGVELVMLVGDLPYYSRFGFRPIGQGRITLPGPVDPGRFLALELTDGALSLAVGMVSPPLS